MKQLNFLIIVSDSISLKEYDNVNYVFPLSSFCVGFIKTYNIEDIKVSNAYLYLNRLLDTLSINALKDILYNLPSNIKGIIFEDLGVYELVKDLKLTKILYTVHSNCNYQTINAYLKKVDSVVISPDITLDETKEILKMVDKKVVLYGLGHLSYMYSRRTLNTNYALNFGYQADEILKLNESISNMPFFSVENNYGTVLYDDKIYNAHMLKDEDNVLAFLINSFETNLDTDELIKAFLNNKIEKQTTGFLQQKTIYKLKQGGQNEKN